MKKVLLIGLLALASYTASAQSGMDGFNYQSIVRGADGQPLKDKTMKFRFSVMSGPNGSAQYVETADLKTTTFGTVSHIVGKGTPVTGTMSGVPFGNADQYLKVEADLGAGFVTVGNSQLVAVPYA